MVDLSAAEAAIEEGANVNATFEGGYTVLMMVASTENEDSLQFLLDRGAEVNYRAPDGQTALTIAIARNRLAQARRLLQAGADPRDIEESKRLLLERSEDDEDTDDAGGSTQRLAANRGS